MEPFDCENTVQFLELELFKLRPSEYIKQYVTSMRDVYEKRAMLKECYLDFDSFDYLLSIFVDLAKGESKFTRRLDCFKVLKYAVKYNFTGQQFPNRIKDKIFYLYKKYIFSENEDIAWCLSVMLKDQVLENDQIEWLIENCSKDENILNRVLRYPKVNELIEDWANTVVDAGEDAGEFEGRRSEVYGILIKDTMPEKLKCKDSKALVWGIYYSKNSDEVKQNLLIEFADRSNLGSVAEICHRLNYPKVIVSLINKAKEDPKQIGLLGS